ncbi:hypothetical protein MHT86_06160 [Corynebacterium mastitidis]|uniref:Uncharacterized protein n=1 Tax=Corynebacterium mastitidis TaxID=161890 RepID=A0A2N0X8A7_9CORY|nr:hypothetical protein [Corynebacterium mastitidis]MCH6197078.1 hypothetical protein [Corynebacterium mastitidis]PKF68909.1 hypothetical protein CXB45_04735 [Corynebacterium mastitidis]
MKTPRNILDSLFVKAQARYPVATGFLMRKVVAAASSGSKKKAPGAAASRERVSGVTAAHAAAGIQAAEVTSVERPNGVLAANAAAGIPGYESLRG